MLLEKHTGLAYPHEFCLVGNQKCPQLAGLGVRVKKILGLKNINIYALGIYVDGAAAKRALAGKFKAMDRDALAGSQELLDEVLACQDIEKTLRLVIAFGSLRRAQFVDALEERLAPALKQAGEASTLASFTSQFDSTNFSKGLEITFTQRGKQLVTKIGGQQAGVLSSPVLSKALWDIYAGPDPVSPDAKASFAKTLASVLRE